MQKKQLLIVGLVIILLVVGYMIFGGKGGEQSSDTGANVMDVLKTPGPNASTAERQKHFELALSAAQAATTLQITSCKSNPTVLRTKNGSTFKVKNNDAVEHVLLFDKDHIYKLGANSTTSIKADFGRGAGLYGYGCDKSSEAAGLIFVE